MIASKQQCELVEPIEADVINDAASSRKPNESKFHQQKLPAWQPLLTAGSVFPLFLLIGAAFVPIGAVLFATSQSVKEVSYNYTNCRDASGQYCMEQANKPEYYKWLVESQCKCNISMELKENLTGQVYAYYALTNFYQNHRRYVKSRDDGQLLGTKSADLLQDCYPYRQNASGAWISPCGAIANSLFNDSFQLFYQPSGSGAVVEIPWTSRGIAWASDRERKFGRIANWSGTTKPPNWLKSPEQRSPASFRDDEELIVWMRTAALPSFRKLHRIVQHDTNSTEIFRLGLPSGNYILQVSYAYPVSAFSGTKSFILTTSSWVGGRNPSLGIIYMVVGCLQIVLGAVFAAIHVHANKNAVLSLSYPAKSPGGISKMPMGPDAGVGVVNAAFEADSGVIGNPELGGAANRSVRSRNPA